MGCAYTTEDPGTGLKIHTAPPLSASISQGVWKDAGNNIPVKGDIQIDMPSGYSLHLEPGCLIVSSTLAHSLADA